MKKTRLLVILSCYLSLAVGLDLVKKFIPFLNMPSGGSVNIALIPIIICSFHLGVKYGVLTGFLWFVVSTIIGLNSFFISFAQILFDYIIPSSIIGLASVFYKKKTMLEIELGILFTMLVRTFSICLSGAYFWFDNSTTAGSFNAWIGSFVYNLPYSLITTLMLLIVIPLLLKYLKNYLYNI